MSDDNFTQNHWGSGHNIKANTVNFGKQPFTNLTIAQAEEIYEQVRHMEVVHISFHGTNPLSPQIAGGLRNFLISKGLNAVVDPGVMMRFPPPSEPVSFISGFANPSGSGPLTVVIDADK